MMNSKVLDGWKWQSLDSISIKAPLGENDRSKSTDRGKSGTKRHVLTDQSGIPLSAVTITSANTHDMKAATDTLDNVIVKRPSYKQNLCLR
jgi:putative transposase